MDLAADHQTTEKAIRDADAAVAVLTSSEPQAGKIYELGGSPSVTLGDLAAEVGRRDVAYVKLSPAEYEAKLMGFGLPQFVAHLLADADAAATRGFLDTGLISEVRATLALALPRWGVRERGRRRARGSRAQRAIAFAGHRRRSAHRKALAYRAIRANPRRAKSCPSPCLWRARR